MSRRCRQRRRERPRKYRHQLSPQARPFLEAALACAREGFPVIPCASTQLIGGVWVCSCSDHVCRSPGRHPMNVGGVRSCTTDPATIVRWSRIPFANLGLVLPFGLVALDVGSEQALQHLLHLGFELPVTVKQRTPRGGLHFIFELPLWVKLRDGECPQLSGTRLLTAGRFILIPPSRGPRGGGYEWINPPVRSQVAAAPDWLIAHFLSVDSPRNPISPSDQASQKREEAVVLEFPRRHTDEGDHR